MCREAFHLWKTGIRGRRWQSLFLEKQYRLSTASIILGVSGGVLYASHEAWTYTNLMKQAILSFHPSVGGPGRIDMVPVIFLFGGMLISGWQSGKWRLRLRGNHSWFRHFLGGCSWGRGLC